MIPADRPGDFNQALMELGATVCVPNGAPKCGVCPWQEYCQADRNHSWMEYPKKSARKPRTIEKRTILVIKDHTRIVIRKRPDKGLLPGLYEFPSLEGHASRQEVLQYLEQMGIKAVRITPLSDSRHIFTHKEWHMTGWQIITDELETVNPNRQFLFVKPEETKKIYPIPSAFSAYTKNI